MRYYAKRCDAGAVGRVFLSLLLRHDGGNHLSVVNHLVAMVVGVAVVASAGRKLVRKSLSLFKRGYSDGTLCLHGLGLCTCDR